MFRVRIANFANFKELEVETWGDVAVVGENKVGKRASIACLSAANTRSAWLPGPVS
ncbi:MAG: hypothetical protein WB662_19175 [Methyloceanibacter sp.]